MLNEVINYLISVALRHKGIKSARYQARDLINQQNNNSYFQFIVEDSIYSQFNANSSTFNLTVNIDIIGFPTSDYTVLNAQSDAFQIGLEVISFIQEDNEYRDIISIEDYSFLTLSRFTDDNCAGQRMTIEMIIVSPLNYCTLSDNFLDEIPEEKIETITLASEDECTNNKTTGFKQTITLKPKKK